MPRALITGISGQDGSYLAEQLLDAGYEVHGLLRPGAWNRPLLAPLAERLQRHPAPIQDYDAVLAVIDAVRPDELYHLAAQSFVADSFDDPFTTVATNIDGTLHVLEGVRRVAPDCRLFFAASSEMFGAATESMQSENTPLRPQSPYAISKVAGYHLARNYRNSYGLFVAAGILFNHESPRRGVEFVSRKITSHAAQIKLGLTDKLSLGNLDACRDWGYAPDYVAAMRRMLQHDVPDDFVIATGKTHSVRQMCEIAFGHVGLDCDDYLEIDPSHLRPNDIAHLCGDPSKARVQLNWQATTPFEEMLRTMVDFDLEFYSRAAP